MLIAARMRWRHLRTPEREEIVTLHINEPGATEPSQPSLKVLLLEDRDDFRRVLGEHLRFLGHQATSVNNGVKGVHEIIKAPFDLIICDMMMPQMGGEMFYVAVSRVRPAARQRFIFFTGHKNNALLEAFFRRVDATVLYKPFTLAALEWGMGEVLRKLR